MQSFATCKKKTTELHKNPRCVAFKDRSTPTAAPPLANAATFSQVNIHTIFPKSLQCDVERNTTRKSVHPGLASTAKPGLARPLHLASPCVEHVEQILLRINAEFLVNMGRVGFDGPRRHEQLAGNIGQASAAGEVSEHLGFAMR